MDKKQAKKVIVRRLVGIIVLLIACVVGGTAMSGPRRTEASAAEVQELKEEQADAIQVKTTADDGSGNDQFIFYFMIALIIFVVIIAAVIAVVSAVTSISAAVVEVENEDD